MSEKSNRCTCGKSSGKLNWGTIDGHAFDCPRSSLPDPAHDKPMATGVKFDGEKPRVDLLIDGCPNALEAISQVLTFGAKKYSDHNWQKVPDGEKRYKAALMRHLLSSSKGEKTDSETNLSHLAHAACCVLFMLELELTKDERI